MPDSASRASSRSCTASGVRRYSLPTRVSSSSPKCRRRRARDAESAGWLRPIRAAARVTLRSWSRASSDTSRLRSRLARFTAPVSTRSMPGITDLLFPSDPPSATVGSVTDIPLLDRTDPESAIAAAAKRCSNWGRWGADDVIGTLNFLDEAKRREGAALVRRGASFSLAQSFDTNGPQKGWRRRTNPVHTMTDTGTDAERGNQGFPHGIGGADDVIAMPLQCSTQWDGLGHIFDHGYAWNGRRAGDVVTSEGDNTTGIETVAALIAGRGVLLDVGRAIGTDGELPDGFPITTEHLEATIAAQGDSARVGRGDLLLVRTGRLTRARREGWGDYAGGASPGLSFTTADWLHGTEIAGIATDTWGFEVRPNEFDVAFQPLHQVRIPNIGLFLGEMWDLDLLAADCAADGVWEFFLTAAPLPVTGAVGAPVNPIAVK